MKWNHLICNNLSDLINLQFTLCNDDDDEVDC